MPQYFPYSPSDAAEAVVLWNDCLGTDFPMDMRLWQHNVDHSRYFWAEASHVAREGEKIVGILIAKKPANICCVLVGPKYRRIGIASKLFALANFAKERESTGAWIVGQDRNHLFPGIPTQSEDALAFFEKGLGLKRDSGLITDLNRILEDFEIEPRVLAKIDELADEGITIGSCTSDDIPSLLTHIESNFSPRWLSDTKARLEIEGQPSEIIVARKGRKQVVIGFAHTYTNKSKYLGPSIYWRRLLGENYGGLGPIGVDIEHRKIGLGLALLAASIQSVKDREATDMAIDWTVLVDFYAKVGFKPWKTYYGMRQV
jgi:ribosomal protein S18 acetylase RimI-like enzyme